MRESHIWERNFHVVDDKQEEDKVEKKKNSRVGLHFSEKSCHESFAIVYIVQLLSLEVSHKSFVFMTSTCRVWKTSPTQALFTPLRCAILEDTWHAYSSAQLQLAVRAEVSHERRF